MIKKVPSSAVTERLAVNARSLRPAAATENARRPLNGEQMAPGRAEMASSGEVGDRCTAIHQVLWSLAMNASVDGRGLVTDTIRTVQPVELSVHEMCQATDMHSQTSDDTSSRVRHPHLGFGE